MPKIVGFDNNISESETIKLEVNSIKETQNNTRSLRKRKREENVDTLEVKISDKTEFLTKLNEFIQNFNNPNHSNAHIERNYRLTKNSNFDVWMDHLKSELACYNLLDVINPQLTEPEDPSQLIIQRKKLHVRDIIINRIDEYYHEKILNESNPKEIIKILEEYRPDKLPISYIFIKPRLYQIKLSKNENINAFCERFDSLIRKYDSCRDATPLTEEEKRSFFYEAVASAEPDIRTVNLTSKFMSGKDLTITEIKSYLLRLEAHRETFDENERNFQKLNSRYQVSKSKCYRCNRLSHATKDCWFKSSGKWYCHFCQTITSHKTENCFNQY